MGSLPSVLRPALLALLGALLTLPAGAQAEGWAYHGGDEGGSRYSPLAQINRANVGSLKVAWQYRTGAVAANPALKPFIDFQATPTLLPAAAGGHLIICDPFNKVIALDPRSGAERWAFDPKIDKTPYAGRFKCKGAGYWADASAPAGASCGHRLFVATSDKRLIAIDARDGARCAGFGSNGEVDVEPLLATTLPTDPDSLRGAQLQSPPAVVRDVVAVSSTANKFKSSTSLNGAIRGFDARTGALRWTFDTLVRDPATGLTPTPIEVGGANTWVPMTVDNERDLLFIPTASPAPNYWGVQRPGNNDYANSVIAVRGSTGQYVWHFQTLHHDVWDRDVGSPPMAVTLTKGGRQIPALIQLVKTGMLFTFERDTGKPVFPIEERPVPTDTDVTGEVLSPTQPFPVAPPVLVKNTLTPDDAWGFTAFDRNACRKKIESMRHGGHYEPIMTSGTILYPQPGGGSNWGGGAFDPGRNILVTPVSQIPYYVKLLARTQVDPEYAKRPEAGAPMQKPGYLGSSPYGVQQGPLMSPSFTPCTKPPWNLLVAVDMAKGEILWKVPFGRLDKLMPVPIPLNFGAPTAGGPIVTASGLIFIGATPDNRVHAYDIGSGEEVWTFRTPTSAMATPMTYAVDGKQYVVFAVGGHSWYDGKGVDDYVIAFALPD